MENAELTALQTALRQADRRPIYQWAADFVTIPSALTQPGKFNPEYSRHFNPIFEAWSNPRVRKICVLKPTRGGGTLVSDVILVHTMANDPGPAMWIMQSKPIMDAHAETRILPMLETCPLTEALMPDDKRKRSPEGMVLKNGVPLYLQGPAMGRLQSKGIRYMSLDEIWMPEWEGKVGHALARLDDFDRLGNSKLIMTSQGGNEGTEWHYQWEQSTKSEWMVPCLSCGKYQKPVMSAKRADGSRYGLMWGDEEATKYPDGTHNYGAIAATIRYECEFCGHKHENQQQTQAEWNRRGHYEDTNKQAVPGVVGYHWNAIIFRQWSKLVIAFLQATEALGRGSIDPLRDFIQKDMADFWTDSLANGGEQIHLETIGSEWEEEAFRFLTVDCQDESVFWFVVRAWAKNGDSRRLAFGKLYSFTEISDIQAKFNVRPNNVLIDSGFATKLVYRKCIENGWIALKGDSAASFLHTIKRHGVVVKRVPRSYSEEMPGDPEANTIRPGKKYAPLYRWSNPTIKERTKRLRDGKGAKYTLGADQGRNATDADYQEQMFSEWKRREKNKKTGKEEWIWYHGSKPNHLWDCENMQTLAATMVRCIDDFPERNDAEPTTPAPPATE